MSFSPQAKTLLIELEAIKVALQYRRMAPAATHHAILETVLTHCRAIVDPAFIIKTSVIRELAEWTVTADLDELDRLIQHVYYDVTPSTDQPVISYSENPGPWLLFTL